MQCVSRTEKPLRYEKRPAIHEAAVAVIEPHSVVTIKIIGDERVYVAVGV